MKKFRITTALVLSFVLVLFFITSANAATQGPKIVIPEGLFDFGEVKEGIVLEHSFQILNKGDQPLQIVKVRPG